MGLDIVVYKREVLIPDGVPPCCVRRDDITAEVYTVPPAEDLPHELTRAAEERLGNLARIADLRSELEALGHPTPGILTILADAFASGTVFPIGMAKTVLLEIQGVRSASEQSAPLRRLCASLERVAEASVWENNPMVLI